MTAICWAAAAALKPLAAVMAIEHNLVPSTMQFYQQPIRPVNLDVVPTKARELKLNVVLSNLLWVGGHQCLPRLPPNEPEPPVRFPRGNTSPPLSAMPGRRPSVDTLSIDTLCINSIRFLAMMRFNKAKFPAPGLPMGAANRWPMPLGQGAQP